MNRNLAKSVSGALLLGLLIACLALMVQHDPAPAQGDPPQGPPLDSFSILTEGDAPSTELLDLIDEEWADEEWIDSLGLNLEAARSASTSSSDEVAVVPGSEGVCIASAQLITCSTWVDAELGGLAAIEACSPGLDPGEVRVTGLLPDAAASAAITRPPSAAVGVSAPLNVYSETFSGNPGEVISSGLASPAPLAWDATDESLTECIVPDLEELTEEDEG